MKNQVNSAAQSSFVINEKMLDEKKAMKYVNKAEMVQAIKEICEAIKFINSAFSPAEYTEENSKKEMFEAYGRFYIVYTDLKEKQAEEIRRAEEKAEKQAREAEKQAAEPATKQEVKPAEEEPVKPAKKEKETKETHKRGDAQERLQKYSAELQEKEAIMNDPECEKKNTKEELKAIRHRIASLKRKIERAKRALNK